MITLSPVGVREYLNRMPTTDLYFLNPLAELRRQGSTVPPPRYLAPNVYLVDRTGVIVRYGRATDLQRLQGEGARQIVYIADDDFAAGAVDPGLPEKYRARLAAFVESDWPALTAAAELIVVPGTVLAKLYGAKAVIMPPAWAWRPANTEHFVKPKRLEIAHLGTGSHNSDFAPLAPMLAKLLPEYPRARLTLFAGGAAPDVLKRHPQVVVRHPLSWWRYKRALPGMRFHLALYPLGQTPFNEARSANKLYEHALVGAASLMSPNPALLIAAGSDLKNTFVRDGEDWANRITALLARPGTMSDHVEATYARIIATDPLAAAARQWRGILAAKS
jgi:hypothetical protein